jgi:DNA polymerase III sliding clamp (beta) subunit (PCNA family)
MLLKIEKDKLFKIFKTAAQVVVEKKAGAHVAGSHVLLKVTEKKNLFGCNRPGS